MVKICSHAFFAWEFLQGSFMFLIFGQFVLNAIDSSLESWLQCEHVCLTLCTVLLTLIHRIVGLMAMDSNG